MLKLFKLTKVALLTHAVGKEIQQAHAIVMAQIIAAVIEQSAHGMQQMLHVKQ